MRRLLALLVVTVLVAPFVVAPADSRPPPRTLCPVCEELEDRSGVGDAPLVVEDSTTTVRIDENGTGHWTTSIVVNDGAASELRRNETLRRTLVERAFDRHRVAVEDPRDRETTVDGDTLVVTYRVPEMAHYSTGGVLVVDFFYGAGDPGVWFEPSADSVRIRGPNGTTATHAPDAGETAAGTVWIRSGNSHGDYRDDFFVAFAPEDGPGATLATAVALRATVLRAVVPLVPTLAAVPTALLAGAVGLTLLRGPRLAAASRRVSVGVAFGGVVLSLLAGPGPVRSLAALGPGLLFLPLAVADRRGAPARHLLRVGIVVAPVALVLATGPVAIPSPLLYAPWAGLTAVVGLLAYAAGREPAAPGERPDDHSEADDRSTDGRERLS